MDNTLTSLLVRCWYDMQTDTVRLQVIRTDTTEPVSFGDHRFFLRFSVDEETSVVRCLIRHIASGREAFVQGGPHLCAFIRACLLQSDGPEHNDAGHQKGK